MACSSDVQHRGCARKTEWHREHIRILSPEHRGAGTARARRLLAGFDPARNGRTCLRRRVRGTRRAHDPFWTRGGTISTFARGAKLMRAIGIVAAAVLGL